MSNHHDNTNNDDVPQDRLDIIMTKRTAGISTRRESRERDELTTQRDQRDSMATAMQQVDVDETLPPGLRDRLLVDAANHFAATKSKPPEPTVTLAKRAGAASSAGWPTWRESIAALVAMAAVLLWITNAGEPGDASLPQAAQQHVVDLEEEFLPGGVQQMANFIAASPADLIRLQWTPTGESNHIGRSCLERPVAAGVS